VNAAIIVNVAVLILYISHHYLIFYVCRKLLSPVTTRKWIC